MPTEILDVLKSTITLAVTSARVETRVF